MKRISARTIDQIHAHTDIVGVIGEFVQLRKRGGNHFGLSPFTNEKTPSFAVSPSKGIWKDFSTGKGGNAVSFLMETEGMTYPESLRYLAEKANIVVEYDGDGEPDKPDHSGALKALHTHVADLLHKQLGMGQASNALEYLKSRTITDASIDAFGIGFAPNAWEWLGQVLVDHGYSREVVTLSGLCFENDTNGRLTDRFRNRVMFPITNHFGQVIGFGGRSMPESNGAKYLNSPESEIYHKSKVLYGLSQARKAIADKGFAILTEGYMDVVMLHQHGHANAIASCGTALTKDQCQLLRRFTNNVLIVRDSDKAGKAAMVKDVKMLLSQGMYPSLLPLPDGDDPDSFCRKMGGDGFEVHRLKHTRNFIDFLVRMGKAAHDDQTPQGRAEIIKEVQEVLAVIQDPVLLYTSQQRLAQLMNVPLSVVGARPANAQNSPPNRPTVNDRSSTLTGMLPHELSAFRMLVNHGGELIEDDQTCWACLCTILAEIPRESLSNLFAVILDAVLGLGGFSLDSMLAVDGLAAQVGEALEVQAQSVSPDDLADKINAIQRDFSRHHLDRLILDCREKIKADPDKQPWLTKLQALTKLRKDI